MQKAAGLTRDQARFAVSFVTCILAGILIRLLRNPTGEMGARYVAAVCAAIGAQRGRRCD